MFTICKKAIIFVPVLKRCLHNLLLCTRTNGGQESRVSPESLKNSKQKKGADNPDRLSV